MQAVAVWSEPSFPLTDVIRYLLCWFDGESTAYCMLLTLVELTVYPTHSAATVCWLQATLLDFMDVAYGRHQVSTAGCASYRKSLFV